MKIGTKSTVEIEFGMTLRSLLSYDFQKINVTSFVDNTKGNQPNDNFK